MPTLPSEGTPVHTTRKTLMGTGDCKAVPVIVWQDDMSILKTPLHISASLGHAEVVRVLLAAKAQVSHSFAGGGGPPELKDAVDGCHVEAGRYGRQENEHDIRGSYSMGLR